MREREERRGRMEKREREGLIKTEEEGRWRNEREGGWRKLPGVMLTFITSPMAKMLGAAVASWSSTSTFPDWSSTCTPARFRFSVRVEASLPDKRGRR